MVADDGNSLANGVVKATTRILPIRLQLLDRGQQLLCGSRRPADPHGSL